MSERQAKAGENKQKIYATPSGGLRIDIDKLFSSSNFRKTLDEMDKIFSQKPEDTGDSKDSSHQ